MEFGPHDPTDRDVALAATISRRRTDRRRMSSWPVSPDDLTRIAALAQREGAFCVAIADPAARFHLAGAVAQAAIVQENDPDYATELTLWTGRGNGLSDGVLAASIPATAGNDHGTPGPRPFPHGTLAQPPGKRYSRQTEYVVIATSSDDVLSGTAVPQLVVRVGWTPTNAGPLPRTPRRDVNDVLDLHTRRDPRDRESLASS